MAYAERAARVAEVGRIGMQNIGDAVPERVVEAALDLKRGSGGVVRVIGKVIPSPSAAVLNESTLQICVTPANVNWAAGPVQDVRPRQTGRDGCADQPRLQPQKALPIHAATSRSYALRAFFRTRDIRSRMRATGRPHLEAIASASSPSTRSSTSRRSEAVRAEVESIH